MTRLLASVAAAASLTTSAVILTACSGASAAPPTQCDLNVISSVQAQVNGGHKEPTNPSTLTRANLTSGADTVCAGDYALSFGADPYPSSVALVRGNPVPSLAKAFPDASIDASSNQGGVWNMGHDVLDVRPVSIKEYPNESSMWAIEYISGYNR